VQSALEHLERGARRSGRRLDDLEIIWAVRTGTAATTAEARRLARPTAVHWGVLRWGGHWLGPAGLKLPPLEIPDAVYKIYPDLSHAHDWEAAIKATSFVPDDVVAQLCDAYGLIGTPSDVAGRILEMAKLGVTNLYLMPLLTFAAPEQEVLAFRDVVFPRLRASQAESRSPQARSRTSRSASPSMLKAKTATEMATPGQMAIQGARNMYVRPDPDSIAPTTGTAAGRRTPGTTAPTRRESRRPD